jgi:hypothetical protein
MAMNDFFNDKKGAKMLNKKLFFDNIVKFLDAFGYEFKTQDVMESYIASCYSVFNCYGATNEQVVDGISRIILTTQKKDLYGRPAPLDLLQMAELYNVRPTNIKLEELAEAEFENAFECGEITNEITREVIREMLKEKYKNPSIQNTRNYFVNAWIEKYNSPNVERMREREKYLEHLNKNKNEVTYRNRPQAIGDVVDNVINLIK